MQLIGYKEKNVNDHHCPFLGGGGDLCDSKISNKVYDNYDFYDFYKTHICYVSCALNVVVLIP